MSLPIKKLRESLLNLISKSGRGLIADLSRQSSVPEPTISRIANGPQTTVLYENWLKLHNADPSNIPAPAINIAINDSSIAEGDSKLILSTRERRLIKLFRQLNQKRKDRIERDIIDAYLALQEEKESDI